MSCSASCVGVGSADAAVRAEDDSFAGAFALNGATASGNANFEDVPVTNAGAPTGAAIGISSARAIAAAGNIDVFAFADDALSQKRQHQIVLQ